MAGIIEMEFSGRGNGWTQVTDVILGSGISWHRGFPGSRMLDLVADVGALHFSLDNSERNSAGLVGYYSPDHVNKRSGFDLNMRVRYRIGTKIRFTGILSAIDPVPGKHGPRTVACEVLDWMDMAHRTRLANLPVQVNQTGDTVFQVLVDSLPIVSQPDAVEKDLSNDTYPYTLDRTRDEQTVFRDELYRLCLSGLDRSWVRGDGTLVYESRTRRAIAGANLDTYTDHNGFIAARDRTSVTNRVQTTVHPRLPSATDVVMYALASPTPIVSGSPVVILGPWTDPANPNVRVGAVDLLTLVPTTDYQVNAAADGSGADYTSITTVTVGLSGNATEFTITLGSSVSGFITKLQQRGKPLYDYGATVSQWQDTTSIGQHGLAVETIDMPYQSDPRLGLEVAQYLVFTSAYPVTQISGLVRYVDFDNALELARSIDRNISDRVGLTDSVTGVDRSFFINAIDETETDGVLKTEFLLVPADTTAFWLLEVVGRSELDMTTRLGFGLVVGHTDIAHADSHGDTAHGDSAHTDTHTDDAHQDTLHGDGATHGDTAHSDTTHSDTAHSDVAHVDWHSDTAHNDTAHVDSHSDVVHEDVAHVDTPFEHGDEPGVPNLPHGDSHTDSAHADAHSDVSHEDVSHTDGHGDLAHSDVAHTDVAHIDTAHSDNASHADSAHSDSAHGDVAHADVTHVDAAHSDEHGDVSHADVN